MAPLTAAAAGGLAWLRGEISQWSHSSDRGAVRLDDGTMLTIPSGCPAQVTSTCHANMLVEIQRVGDVVVALRSR